MHAFGKKKKTPSPLLFKKKKLCGSTLAHVYVACLYVGIYVCSCK